MKSERPFPVMTTGKTRRIGPGIRPRTLFVRRWMFAVAVGLFCARTLAGSGLSDEGATPDTPPEVLAETYRLSSTNPVERAAAAAALGEMGPRAATAIPDLCALLPDHTPLAWVMRPAGTPFPSVAGLGDGNATSPGQEAAKALVTIGVQSVPALIQALPQRGAENALTALKSLRDPRAIKPIVDGMFAVTDGKPHIRYEPRTAWFALQTINAAEAEPLYVEALDRFIREQVERLKTVDRMDYFLIRELTDGIRGAINGVAETGSPRFLDILLFVIENEPQGLIYHNRADGMFKLAKINEPRSIEALIRFLEEPEWPYRKSAAEALEQLTGQSFGLEAVPWRKWWETRYPRAGAHLPGDQNPKQQLP